MSQFQFQQLVESGYSIKPPECRQFPNTGLDIFAEHGRCSPAGDIALSGSGPMNPRMISRRPEPVLRAAGWALVVNEPVAPADMIVVSPDSGGAGALEAADLVQSGIAKGVAVFVDPPSGEDHEFIRRGLPYEGRGARQIRQLRSLGVTDVVQIPSTDVGR